jgi:hypothetical protein
VLSAHSSAFVISSVCPLAPPSSAILRYRRKIRNLMERERGKKQTIALALPVQSKADKQK